MQRGAWRILKNGLKLALGLGLLAWLIVQAARDDRVLDVVRGHKDWRLLGASALCIAAAVLNNFFRWRLLVEAAGLTLSVGETLKLGSLGHALNFLGPGSVGGDVLKAALFARSHPGKRRVAVTTILVDRFLGLLTLLAVGAIAAVIALSSEILSTPVMRGVAQATLVVTAVALGVAVVAFVSGPHSRWVTVGLGKLPGVGRLASDMFAAVQTMGSHPAKLPLATVMSMVSHVLLVLSFYFVSLALPLEEPTLARQFATVPIAELAGALPLTPGGLGTTEAVLDLLWQCLGLPMANGTLVAVGQRLVNLSVGALAMFYYFAHRNEVQPVVDGEAVDAS